MSVSKIAKYGKGAHGDDVVEGCYAVDPSGHLVLIHKDNDLPDAGWRWASQGDIDTAERKAAAIAGESAELATPKAVKPPSDKPEKADKPQK